MLRSNPRHNGLSGRTVRKMIALFQVLVLLALAVPACCYGTQPEHETAVISRSAETPSDSQDACPCCPDEGQPASDSDACSTCSYCTFHVPMTVQVSASYAPSVSPLIVPERFSRLPEVHIPIFVPPQNLV